MRRKEREVSDRKEIIEILRRCDSVCIGMQGGEYPYVVPVSFGMEVADDMPVVYFHCAKEGMKLDMLRDDPRVCMEGDTFLGIQKTLHGITTRYESVIGFGSCTFVEDETEKIKGLRLILEHYDQNEYPLDRCRGLNNLYIGKITLNSITGKRNRPDPTGGKLSHIHVTY